MEATTASSPSTGSRTIADLLPLAAEKYATNVAAPPQARRRVARRHLRRGRRDRLRDRARPARPRDREGRPGRLLANTRPEWTYVDFAISRGRRRPSSPSTPPTPRRSASGSRATPRRASIVCEDASQVAKIAEIRDSLPKLETVIVIDPARRRRRRDLARRPARARARASTRPSSRSAPPSVTPEDAFTFIYTSGTTGPPKGCVLSHGNYRRVLDMCESIGVLEGGEDTAYLFLPARPRLRAADPAAVVRRRRDDRLLRRRHEGRSCRAGEVKPTYLPSVPRIFEKIYTLATTASRRRCPTRSSRAMVALGVKVRDADGARPGGPGRAAREVRRRSTSRSSRRSAAIFGGNVRQAVTGAAPIAQEILEFFYACGVPVLEGYGMTETATVATYSTIERPQVRHRRAARCPASSARSPRTASSSQGREHLPGLLQGRREELRHDHGRLAAHRRPGHDRRGRLRLDHRAQEGHHHHRGRQEPHAGD